MKVSKLLLGGILGASLATSGIVIAQEVNAHRHPNLASAQSFIDQALLRISAAQRANEFDMGGHAAKAKDLLDQANREVKLAAAAADHR